MIAAILIPVFVGRVFQPAFSPVIAPERRDRIPPYAEGLDPVATVIKVKGQSRNEDQPNWVATSAWNGG